MKFSTLRLNKTSVRPTYWVSHAMDSQASLRNDESAHIAPEEELFRSRTPVLFFPHVTRPLFFSIGISQGFQRGVDMGWKRPSQPLCSLSQSRLSWPAASRHAPVAPDCLIRTFQVRGSDKSGQSTQTVIHLFCSHRCSWPPFSLHLVSVKVNWRQGREDENSNTFFHQPL